MRRIHFAPMPWLTAIVLLFLFILIIRYSYFVKRQKRAKTKEKNHSEISVQHDKETVLDMKYFVNDC